MSLLLALLPLVATDFAPSLHAQFLVAIESSAIHFKRVEPTVNQRCISFNDTYNTEHQLNYGPDTIFVRALGSEIRAWIARRTTAHTYTVEFDAVSTGTFWIDASLLHSNYTDVDETTTAWSPLLWESLFRGEIYIETTRVIQRAYWHVLDHTLIQKAFGHLSRVSEDGFEERARALAYGAVYVDANDCDWRSLENRVIWWYGDSQMRTLVFEIAKQFNVSVPAIDFQLPEMEFTTTKNVVLRFRQNVYGQYTHEELTAGDVVIFNFGQWPMSGQGHWSTDRYAAQLTLVRKNLIRAHRTVWLNTLPLPLRDDHWVRDVSDQRTLVRTIVFNRIAARELSPVPELTRINVNEIAFPFVDLSSDSAHYRNTPMISAIARRVMHNICRLLK